MADAEHKTITQFRRHARAFCDIVEQRSQFQPSSLLRTAQHELVDIYRGALELPDLKTLDFDFTIERDVKEWKQLYLSMREKLGNYDLYWQVFNPYERDEGDPIPHGLSDDLTDTYFDLRDGLFLWDLGTDETRYEAVRRWRFDFQSHYGKHVANAIYVIHAFVEKFE